MTDTAILDDGVHHEGHSAPEEHGTTGLSNNKMGMWLFLGSECLLFGGLISTYMLYRGRHSGNLGPDQIFDIPFTSVSSFVLLMSSLTMVLAVSAAKRNDDRNTRLWLIATASLGRPSVTAKLDGVAQHRLGGRDRGRVRSRKRYVVGRRHLAGLRNCAWLHSFMLTAHSAF